MNTINAIGSSITNGDPSINSSPLSPPFSPPTSPSFLRTAKKIKVENQKNEIKIVFSKHVEFSLENKFVFDLPFTKIDKPTKIKQLIELKIPFDDSELLEIFKAIKLWKNSKFVDYAQTLPLRLEGEIETINNGLTPKKRTFYLDVHNKKQIYLFFKDQIIQQGSFKKLHQAWHLNTPKLIAYAITNVLNRSFTEDFLNDLKREEDLLCQMNYSSFTPDIFGAYAFQNERVLMMEYFPQDLFTVLEKMIDRISTISDRSKIAMAKQLALSIKYIHDQKIIHRDIKIENFLVKTERGKTKIALTDFGLACLADDQTNLERECGTFSYLPYEFFSHENYISAYSTDMWALGIVLFIMWSECPPPWQQDCQSLTDLKFLEQSKFKNQKYQELFVSIRSQMDEFNRTIIPQDNKAALLIRKLLEKDPAKRMTISETLEELQQIEQIYLDNPQTESLADQLAELILV